MSAVPGVRVRRKIGVLRDASEGADQRPSGPRSLPSAPGTRPRARRVRALYGIAGARWYDPFRAAWTALTSRPAEAAIDRLVRQVAQPTWSILDIGCGSGYNLTRLRRLEVPFAAYLGVDLSPAMLAIAREHHADEPRAQFVEGDLHVLGAMQGRFDLVLCTWVASHLERPREVFEIAHHLLAPGGHALLLLMTRPPWYVRWWFAPFAWLFQARWVDPEVLGDLPGLTWTAHFRRGLVTAVHLVR